MAPEAPPGSSRQSKRKRMPKQPSRKRLRASESQRRQGRETFRRSRRPRRVRPSACPPVGASVRRRVRPSARPPGRLRGRGRTKPAAQVQRRGRSMSQKVFSCKELSKDRFVHQSIIGADASCLQRVRLSAKSEQGLILPSPFQSCTSDRPPKCQVYADRTCTWQYLPLSCGAKPPFPSRHGTGPAVCV